MVSDTQLLAIRQQLKALQENKTLDGEGADRSENLHRLFMYPAMMVPATQYAVIQAVADTLPQGAWVMDPFMGSGTSLMSCMEFGFNVYGQDINPFAVMLTQAKVEEYDIVLLKAVCQEVVNQIFQDADETVDVSFTNIDKWFNKDVQIDLSRIRRAIQSVEQQPIRRFLWVIMSEVIRTGSNDRTSTFKLHRRSEEDIEKRNVNVTKEFSTLVLRGIEDIEVYWNKVVLENQGRNVDLEVEKDIQWGNTKDGVMSKVKFDLLVSSPPYGDNHTTVTYGQTSYLPLQWIDPRDLSCPFDYVKTTQEIDRQSLGGKINRKNLLATIGTVYGHTPTLRFFFENVPDEERNKYYKTLSFISDFDASLDKIVASMKDDAFYIWTIGNRFVGGREIPNDQILIELMESRGIMLFERAERQILNKKQARKNSCSQTMEKEHILIFRKI
jgi:hypothetical protein